MPSKPVDDKLEKLIVETIEKSLKDFGFISAERKCYTPKYGKDAYTIEDWDARTVGMFVAQDVESALNAHFQKKYQEIRHKDGERYKSRLEQVLKDQQKKYLGLSPKGPILWPSIEFKEGFEYAISEALANIKSEGESSG